MGRSKRAWICLIGVAAAQALVGCAANARDAYREARDLVIPRDRAVATGADLLEP